MTSKSILITGCSSGIGLCAAHTLHQRGYTVFATVRTEEDAQPLQAKGIHTFLWDVTDYDQLDFILNAIAERGELHALFNNAGYSQMGAAEDLSLDALKAQMETNFFAPVELGNRVIEKFFRPQGHGRIVQNTSVFGLTVMPFRAAYCASKYALEAFTDALRLEQNIFGTHIKVSLIEPGPIVSKVRENKKIHFDKHIAPIMHKSRYKTAYETMQNALAMTGKIPMTLPADAAVDALIHALESPHPKPRYYVTRLTSLFAFAKRVLPHRVFDTFSARMSRKETGQ